MRHQHPFQTGGPRRHHHHPAFAERGPHGPHAEARFRSPRGGHRGGPFGPGGPGGPGGPFEHGPHGGPRRGRGRAPRGDVRTAVLLLLSEQPMHGYQLMQAIADRSGGRWTPSPGAIYPTISQLEDEGLVTVVADAGRKLVTITDAGREQVQSRESDPFAAFGDAGPRTDLRALLEQVHGATRQVGRTGSEAQISAAAAVLADARRRLYLLLADGPDATGTDAPADSPASE
ncbi:MAG: PadR family transcriptional regulator [Jatrophihabitans sp.]|uniref:PadR family transcriptional regulator n=1 Tax=Jatrophihabitans sp. TaxID=1932789 RepID=UPI003F80FD5B